MAKKLTRTRTRRLLKPVGSAGWSKIPSAEGWWWDSDGESWIEMGSADMSTVIVDTMWRGLWYGPIIIPEKPNDKVSSGDNL